MPAVPIELLLGLLVLLVASVLAMTVFLPTWFPEFHQSMLGDQPKAFWFLSRASAFVAFGLVWLSMILGLLMTNKLARMWPGGPTAFDLHQYVSLLGIGFGLYHALILIGDRFINYTFVQLLVPFASVNYHSISVGLGQLSFYVLLLVSLTFYVRRTITQPLWRLIHYLSFVLFVLVLAHGLWSGTDSTTQWAQSIYWVSGGSVLFLTVYRLLSKHVVV